MFGIDSDVIGWDRRFRRKYGPSTTQDAEKEGKSATEKEGTGYVTSKEKGNDSPSTRAWGKSARQTLKQRNEYPLPFHVAKYPILRAKANKNSNPTIKETGRMDTNHATIPRERNLIRCSFQRQETPRAREDRVGSSGKDHESTHGERYLTHR